MADKSHSAVQTSCQSPGVILDTCVQVEGTVYQYKFFYIMGSNQ